MILGIYVPAPGTATARAAVPRTAFVGDPASGRDGLLPCHYEGAVHGQAMDFSAKLSHAGGRLATRYPTTARASFPAAEMLRVGTYDASRHVAVEVSDPAALEAWSGEPASAVLGARVPAGPLPWADAAAVCRHPDARPVGGQGREPLLFKTRAGQVVAFRAASREAFAYDHDDPALRDLLESRGMPADAVAMVVGAPPPAPPVPGR